MPKVVTALKPGSADAAAQRDMSNGNQRDSMMTEDRKRVDKHTYVFDHKLWRRFGKGLRGETTSKFETPGPDQYQRIETDWRKKRDNATIGKESCTFGMKTMKFFQLNNNPGPGAHMVELVGPMGIAYSVGHGLRAGQEHPLYTDKYYDPAAGLIPAPAITFGTERKQTETKKSKFPGPGTYNVTIGRVGDVPAYLMKPTVAN